MNQQTRARLHLERLGIRFWDKGHGFIVYGRFGHYMTPGEVLNIKVSA